MGKKKTNNIAVCIICAVLTAFGIVGSIVSLASGNGGLWMITVRNIINLALSILIGYYAVSGYRIPNGNLLKYIILVFAVSYLILIAQMAQLGLAWHTLVDAIIVGLLSYAAGRLHRVKQNMILMGIAAALILYGVIVSFAVGATIGIFTPLVIWIDICVAYVLRYKEHKLAGLMDRVRE